MGGGENREVIVYVRARRRQSRGKRRSRRERQRSCRERSEVDWQEVERSLLAGSRCDGAVQRGVLSWCRSAEEDRVHMCVQSKPQRGEEVFDFVFRVCEKGGGGRAAAYPSFCPLKPSQEKGKGLTPLLLSS